MRDRSADPAGGGDLATLAVGFSTALRAAGVATNLERAGRFVRAVSIAHPAALEDLYWAARITLVADPADFAAFDRVFGQVFGGLVDMASSRGDLGAPPTGARRPAGPVPKPPPRTDPATAGQQAGGTPTASTGSPHPEEEPVDRLEAPLAVVASRDERLAGTDFSAMDDDQLRALAEVMRQLPISLPLRRARRPRRHRLGDRIDLRATLRRSRRTAGDPVRHVYRRRLLRPRRLVVLCDISGSMEPYARAYVQFLHAARGSVKAEVFTFATRLTRLSRALSGSQPELALRRAAEAAPDWHGGTRIGEALKTFLDEYGRRGMARGAVIVVVSDGWERDDPSLLGEQMARLARLAHRVVWVNPRRADPRYRPLAGGMAAALPHCDALVSGHSLSAMGELLAALDG